MTLLNHIKLNHLKILMLLKKKWYVDINILILYATVVFTNNACVCENKHFEIFSLRSPISFCFVVVVVCTGDGVDGMDVHLDQYAIIVGTENHSPFLFLISVRSFSLL